MTTPKAPQDRKAPSGHAFTVKGKRYILPNVTEDNAGNIPGKITYDAVMNPDVEVIQVRLALANLDASGASQAAKDALLSLSTGEMMTIVGEWLGESSGSSD